jgi:DNA-binding response OmpR family regulator
VLTIEDDDDVRLMLKMSLEDEGFDVSEAPTAFDGLARFAADRPDLVLVDLKLPDRSGFDVCRALRQTSGVPIIILTANEADTDVVTGLDAGADDYITKPFQPKVLAARIRALLRRAQGVPDATAVANAVAHGLDDLPVLASADGGDPIADTGVIAPPPEAVRVFGTLSINALTGDVRLSGQSVHLTKTELRLLLLLTQEPNRVFSREQLLEQVWGYEEVADGRLVDVHVRRLRTKVEVDPAEPAHILTARGTGYRFVE